MTEPGRLRLSLGGVLAPPLKKHAGLSRPEIETALRRIARRAPHLFGTGQAADAPAFIQAPWRSKELAEVTRTAQRLRRSTDDVIQVGIGGSSLAAQTLMGALAHPLHNQLPKQSRKGPRVHFADNADPETLGALLDCINPKRTLLHLVSKTGETLETNAVFRVLRQTLGRDWRQRCVITTGAGALRAFAKAEGVPLLLNFPENLGGRWSALSASGLFVPALAGVPVTGVISGARRLLRRNAAGAKLRNPAALAAATAFLLDTRRGKSIQVLMPYADALEALTRWYVQLAAESLGKLRRRGGLKREHLGPTPLPARGSSDQHAQLQLFIEGPADKLLMFVALRRSRTHLTIPGGRPAGDPSAGQTLGRVLRVSQQATALALAQAGRPSLTFELPSISPAMLGELLLTLQLMTAGQAALYGVNPFDQPGVEAGKEMARALLGHGALRSPPRARAPRWRVG